LRIFDRNVAKARRKTRLRALSKLTERVDGKLRLASDPPVLVPLEEVFSGPQAATAEARIRKVLEGYRDTLGPARHLFDGYRYVHAARKVVGVEASKPAPGSRSPAATRATRCFCRSRRRSARCSSSTAPGASANTGASASSKDSSSHSQPATSCSAG